jgi:hypothetical protein
MMKLKLFIVACCTLPFFILGSCNPQKQSSGYYSFETECLGVELDGSQTLKAWGKGSSKKDAVEQARKNAVRDVLFKGIRKGSPECSLKPLIVNVSTKEEFEQYFALFFTDGGSYTSFVSNKDHTKVEKHVAGSQVVYGVTVRVLRSKLKQQLIMDNILKQ